VVEGVCMYMMSYVWVVEQERGRGFSATGRSTMLPAGLGCLAMSKNSCGRDTDMTEHLQHSTSSTPAPHRAKNINIPSPSTTPPPPPHQPPQPLLLPLPPKNRPNRLPAQIHHLPPAKPKVLRSQQILVRQRAAENPHIVRLQSKTQ
jgi:hypothetical protein